MSWWFMFNHKALKSEKNQGKNSFKIIVADALARCVEFGISIALMVSQQMIVQ